jgi:hypothetical protein
MTIFGNNGKMATGNDKMKYWNDGGIQIKSGNKFQEGGSIATFNNNVMWTPNGMVTMSNNIFWGPDGVYHLGSNGVLHGPNGHIWTGVSSKQDAMSIIAHKMK